jgi:serine/threonine-protein kinase
VTTSARSITLPLDRPGTLGPLAAAAGRMLGRFRPIELLAQGGMGWIWRGCEMPGGRAVALKTLPPQGAPDRRSVLRLAREVEAARLSASPHVVEIIDARTSGRGVPFVALELLEGPTLGELARSAVRLPIARAVDLGRQLLAALERVHAAGIVHRDVKSDNVMLARRAGRDRLKLLDFGVALLPRASAEAAPASGESCLVGTPRFMSPEQALGEDRVDARSDLYSAALVLYQVLTGGVLPHATPGARPFEIALARQREEAAPLSVHRPDAPAALGRVLARALARHPDDRWSSATEMRRAWESCS